jgi:hypothetical protein
MTFCRADALSAAHDRLPSPTGGSAQGRTEVLCGQANWAPADADDATGARTRILADMN